MCEIACKACMGMAYLVYKGISHGHMGFSCIWVVGEIAF